MAGGSLDLRDVVVVLEGGNREAIINEVETHISAVGPDVRDVWRRCLQP